MSNRDGRVSLWFKRLRCYRNIREQFINSTQLTMEKKRSQSQELESIIYQQFRENLSEEFDIFLEQRLDSRMRADIAISKEDIKLAIIEIKPNLYDRHDRLDIERHVTNLAYNGQFRYAIIAVDANTLLIKDCYLNKNDEFKRMKLEAICHAFEIIRNPDYVPGKEYREAVFEKLKELMPGEKAKAFYKKNRAAAMMRDEDSFYFANEDLEDGLFDCFLKKFDDEKICRYTSLSSLYRTINDGEQSMCCIVGMNDRSECTYADNYIKGQQNGNNSTYKTPYEAEVENKFFILSCMEATKYDELTMWRLYGDNTRGVNILYDVNKGGLKGFKLYYIDYAEANGSHRTLDMIKSLMALKVDKRTFRLRKWDEWKHFFKPYEYRDEKEIRLLYNRKDKPVCKWILTSDYQIACPLMIFKLDTFPLKMEEVKLGPNCPDIVTNQQQVEMLMREKLQMPGRPKTANVVKTSVIGTYR